MTTGKKVAAGVMIGMPIVFAAIPWVNKGIREKTDVGGRVVFSIIFGIGGAVLGMGVGMGIMRFTDPKSEK